MEVRSLSHKIVEMVLRIANRRIRRDNNDSSKVSRLKYCRAVVDWTPLTGIFASDKVTGQVSVHITMEKRAGGLGKYSEHCQDTAMPI